MMRDCESLKEHTLRHSVDLDSFIPNRVLSRDLPLKVDVSDLGCQFCPDVQIKDLEELITHIIFDHNEHYEPELGVCVLPFILSMEHLNCVLCEKYFDNFTSLLGHMYKLHVNHPSVCQICGLSFMSATRLSKHMTHSHIGYKCTTCGKMFSASHRLEKHKQFYHGHTKHHECDLCRATFENSYQLKVHLGKMHNVEKYTIKCEHCPKVCTTKGAMVLHVKSQHSDIKYECDLCDYKAGIQWLITLHKRKHLGVKDYKCNVCDKLFRRSSNLRAHMKVHSGSSGRVCRTCRQGFTDSDALKAHQIEVHNQDE